MYYTRSVTQDLANRKVYLLAALFVACNVILPQIFHLFGLGGTMFLPVLLFTLYAAARFGAITALITGVFSPIISHLLTGMPDGVMLSVLIFEGIALSALSLIIFKNSGKIGLKELLLVIVGYQLAGMLFHWILSANFATAWHTLYISLPGMIIHLFVVWLLIRKCTTSKI